MLNRNLDLTLMYLGPRLPNKGGQNLLARSKREILNGETLRWVEVPR